MLHINYIHKHTRSLIHISQRVKFVLSLRAVILLIAAPRLSFNIKIVFAGSVADGVYSRVCGCVPSFPQNSTRQNWCAFERRAADIKSNCNHNLKKSTEIECDHCWILMELG